jgi:hypothetical protein
MSEAITIKDTPLNEAIEEARKLFESKGYTAEITGVEKCYITGYEDAETEMTDLALITCLDNGKHSYRVYSNLIKKAAKELDLKKPVWVVIFRLNIGLVVVSDILEHTDQLELLFQQMKANLKK